MVHMYRDHVYEEYGRVDPLPEGYTISAVYPLLDVAVECGDEKEMLKKMSSSQTQNHNKRDLRK